MRRELQGSKASVKDITGVVPISKGGTGAATKAAFIASIGAIEASKLGAPFGVIKLDANGFVPAAAIPAMGTPIEAITGPKSLSRSAVGTYVLTAYDAFKTYTLTPINGTVSRTGDTITYTAPATLVQGGFDINGTVINVTITPPIINTPSITSPVNNATGTGLSVTATSSAFGVSAETDTHSKSHWQIASDAGFANIIADTGDSNDLLSHVFAGLAYNTAYYIRCRYKGASGVYSAWSAGSKFTTMIMPVVATPAITSPGNGAGNQPLALTLYSSAFALAAGSDTHATTHWQVASDAGFGNLLVNTGDSGSLTALAIGGLGYSVTYYVRCRYKSAGGFYSAWSATSQFTTQAPPVTTTPTAYMYDISGLLITNLAANATKLETSARDSQSSVVNNLVSDFGMGPNTNYGNGQGLTQNVNLDGIYGISSTAYIKVRVYSSAGGWSAWSPELVYNFP